MILLQIRHCTEKSNVDESLVVIDPLKIKHAVLKGGKLSLVSGFIDPKSHLNLDYPYHLVKKCVIAEKFEVGSKVEISDAGLIFAELNPSNYKHYGKYDYTQNFKNMVDAVKKVRTIENDNSAKSIDNKTVTSMSSTVATTNPDSTNKHS